MAKHRSFKLDKFLKAVDPLLRGQYFTKHGVTFPDNINFNDDSLDNFWETIPEANRVEIEEQLHCVNDIADQARDCLEQACRDFGIQKQANELPETTAMRVFLHDNEEAYGVAFDAYLYYILSERVTRHKFQNATLTFDDGRKVQFKTAVEQHFLDSGKGTHCAIRHRIDGDKHILLIARGDFMKTHLIFDDQQNKPDIRSFRPAKEDMLVFDKNNNILSMSLSGHSDDDKEKYLEMFGNTFLGVTQIDNSTVNNSLVDLDPIKNRTFNFGGNEQVESVKLTEINAKLRGGAMRLILKSNDLAGVQGYGVGSDGAAEFVSAKLKFFIKREGKKSKGFVVEVRQSGNSKIPQKKEKQIIEDYLREQGVLLE